MIKTFLVHAAKTTQVAPRKGLITWLVTDENRVPRKVMGLTELDESGLVKTVKPVYSRETPLVEALTTLVRGDLVTIDFRPFNLTHGYEERLVYESIDQNKRFLLPRLSKLVALATLACALGIALVLIYHYL
ncbi:hypothetical protein [uncultured Thiothrix sp.]|jgi:hypothetical protein|uniref:hypothetical protein n=1 Tax=uncultured Thiothrix sp. TaxID=223185 RepID=UPI00261B8AE2|nr:hypothetical protein [uncultured Thiothrix sp.]HMT93784.1 hypothetical protein [Thiolinea sp.]